MGQTDDLRVNAFWSQIETNEFESRRKKTLKVVFYRSVIGQF